MSKAERLTKKIYDRIQSYFLTIYNKFNYNIFSQLYSILNEENEMIENGVQTAMPTIIYL